ncbi:MAG: hypothetical protein KF708_22380 [Pirellulales bacterium]|nr:hypothetical protein [Pirellulales bacterium]
MNCDRVFDILTRGPFPSGAPSDERVERHLSNCPACRRLAAALQPAIELFEEAITPDEGRDLPAYWGDLFVADQDDHGGRYGSSSWRGGTSTRLATKLRHATGLDLETVRRTLPTAWRLSAAVLLGICIGGLLRSADLGSTAAVPPVTPTHSEAFAADTDDDKPLRPVAAAVIPSQVSLAELRLVACTFATTAPSPPKGRKHLKLPPHDVAPIPLQARDVACCTDCHNAHNEQIQITRETTVQIVHTCKHCHTD